MLSYDKISGKGNFIFRIICHIFRKKIKKTVSMFFFVLMIKKWILMPKFLYICVLKGLIFVPV